jgi:hypothetical protein
MKPFEDPNSAVTSTPCDDLSSSATFDPEPLLDAFEQAWQSGNRPPIETILTRLPQDDRASETARRRLLVENGQNRSGTSLARCHRGRV